MHVLLVTPSWTTEGYGGEFSVRLLREALLDRGDSVTVAARDVDGAADGVVEVDGSAGEFAGIVRRRGADVVHCYNNQLQLQALVGAKLSGVPAVATANSYWATCLFADMTFPNGDLCDGCSTSGIRRDYRTRDPATIGTKAPAALARLEVAKRTWTLSRFDRIVALSEASRRRLAKGGVPGEQMRVVPNMVDPRDLQRELPEMTSEPNVLYAGQVTNGKGVRVLVDAFEQVLDVVPEATLRIAGDGHLEAALESTVADRGIEAAVELLGRVDPDRLRDLYRDSRVFAFPVIWDEPFGRVILESWAHGAAFVTTSRGGPGDVVDDGRTGLVAPPQEPDALAERIVSVLRDDDLARSLREAGRQELERYRPERVAEQYVGVYRSVM